MKVYRIAVASILLISGQVHCQSLIVCKLDPKGGATINSIWPAPYLAPNGALCFDVKGWPEYSGQNCATDGGHAAWTGLVIVSMDGDSQGRDSTRFRVNKAVVKDDRLEYVIEWSRGGGLEADAERQD